MTQVFPISSVAQQPTTAAPKPPDNQFGKDTFLKLLVAQMKYQNPLSPTDSSQFLTQTAQFTQLETLQKIETSQEALAKSTQMLAAASLVGRPVSYSLSAAGLPATATGTTIVSIRGSLPKDAVPGAQATANTDIYTAAGQKVPLTLKFMKTSDGWSVQATSNGQGIGNALALKFDASGDRPATDLSIPAGVLDGITGTSGGWPLNGITLGFGSANDPTRLHIASGPANVAVAEQNGNDGQNATGVVTGIHMTADGPELVIGGHNIPLASISDVQS
jgi:flagellar basal-body rod modification protein FlgD